MLYYMSNYIYNMERITKNRFKLRFEFNENLILLRLFAKFNYLILIILD